MKDQIDGRLWIEHHDAFSRVVVDALDAAGAALRRLGSWDGTAAQLLAMVTAFAVTALSFRTTIA